MVHGSLADQQVRRAALLHVRLGARAARRVFSSDRREERALRRERDARGPERTSRESRPFGSAPNYVFKLSIFEYIHKNLNTDVWK